ncbi:MAG: TonB-dependent receptor [Verrucomicrobiota bacterium JB022]|nr:TonB-dependent receptor [Verrucomicrobiota bacterium JB022]
MKPIARCTSLAALVCLAPAWSMAASVCETPVAISPQIERLGKAFREIEAQTAFRFSYVEDEVDLAAGIEIPEGATTLAEVLESLAEYGQLQFRRIGNQLAVRPGAPEVIDPDCFRPAPAPAASPDFNFQLPAPEIVELEAFSINSFAFANGASIQHKRQGQGIQETLSADEAGRLPDFNVADALRRVPGVMSILDEEESRYISIRAARPDYINATIDGIPIAAQDFSRRRINLEAIPTNAVLRLEVAKTVQPDRVDSSIAGTVNLVTRSPFDADLPTVSLVGYGGYFDSRAVPGEDGHSWRGELTVAEQFGPRDMFGLLYGYTYYEKNRDQEKTNQNSYRWYNDSGFRVEGPHQGNGIPVTHHFDWFVYDNTVTRQGHLLKLEARPSSWLNATLQSYYYSQEDEEQRHVHHLYNRGTVSEQTATTGRISTGEGAVQFTEYPPFRMNFGVSLQVKATLPFELDLHAAIAYSAAEENLYDYDSARFTTPSTDSLAYRYDMSHMIATYELEQPEYFNDPANYRLDYFDSIDQDSDEDIYTGQLKLSRRMGPDDLGLGFFLGLNHEATHRDYAYDREIYHTTNSNPVTVADAYWPVYYVPPHRQERFILVDFAAFRELMATQPERFVEQAGTSILESLVSDFVYDEELLTGVGLLRYGGKGWSILVGGHFETVESEVLNMKRANGRYTPTVMRNRYERFLPSASLRLQPTDSLVLRLAASQAVAHPQIEHLVIQQREEISSRQVTVTRGNPDLKPTEALNLDAAAEYYFDGGNALFSIGLFQKEIDGEVYIATHTFERDGIPYSITQPENGESSLLRGVELSLVQNRLHWLPGPLQDFGLSLNATLLKGETAVHMHDGSLRELDHALEQPDYFWNASVFYARGRFEAQVGYTYTGKYRAFVDRDYYWRDYSWDAFDQLDVQVAYRLTSRLELRAEVRNLTNSAKLRLRGPEQELLHEIVESGRSFWVGLSYYH